MKPLLDIVVCRTILEQVLGQDMLMGSDEQMALARCIRQHRILTSEQLMKLCEQYFAENAPELLEAYRTFCASIAQSETTMEIVLDVPNPSAISDNPYYAELIGICRNSRDKLLLSEKKEKLLQVTAKKGKGKKDAKEITILNSKEALEESFDNPLFLYTLPITGLMLRETQTNEEIAAWLKRFLEQETYVQIFDNYLFTAAGLYGFEKYILRNLPPDAELQIYTQTSSAVTEETMKKAVQKEKYRKRKLEVYLVLNRRELHERRIQGENFILQFDKGFSVFGQDGKIQKCPISVMKNTKLKRTVISEDSIRRIW